MARSGGGVGWVVGYTSTRGGISQPPQLSSHAARPPTRGRAQTAFAEADEPDAGPGAGCESALRREPGMPRSPAWWSQHCRPIVAILDEHLAGPSQQRGNSNGTLVVYGAMSGIGDQVAGMLGGLALALGAGRRFEIGEEASSLISSWFFDISKDNRRSDKHIIF